MESLGKAWFHHYLAGANRFPGRPPESGEEIIADPAIRDLDGFGPEGQPLELVLGLSDLGNSIEQDLGPKSSQVGTGEITQVVLVRLGRGARQLVGS